MKKAIIKVASIFLISVMLVVALGSCSERYTGGFYPEYPKYMDFYWLETYDECVEAIERMQARGSTFFETMLTSYEGDLFDMKYCILMYESNVKEVYSKYQLGRYKFGSEPFDFKAEKVEIRCYAFFEDVEISDIEYANVWAYKSYLIMPDAEYAKNHNYSYEGIALNSSEYTKLPDRMETYEYTLENTPVLRMKFFQYKSNQNEHLGDEELQAILGSIDVDMYKKMESNFLYEEPNLFND